MINFNLSNLLGDTNQDKIWYDENGHKILYVYVSDLGELCCLFRLKRQDDLSKK